MQSEEEKNNSYCLIQDAIRRREKWYILFDFKLWNFGVSYTNTGLKPIRCI